MKRFAVVAALIIAALAVSWFAYQQWHRSDADARTIRLKAVATVLVDGVERTGSAVQEFRIQWRHQPHLMPKGTWQTVMRGVAIQIDVPGEEPVYVLISAGTLFDNCLVQPRDTDDAFRDRFLRMERCEVKSHAIAVRFDADHRGALAMPIGSTSDPMQFVSMSYQRTVEPVTRAQTPQHVWPQGVGPIRARFLGKTLTITKPDFSLESFF